jgi:hypothetical protein
VHPMLPLAPISSSSLPQLIPPADVAPMFILRPVSLLMLRRPHDVRQGRKPWNATDLRDPVTGKWILDMSMVKPVVLKKHKSAPEQVP